MDIKSSTFYVVIQTLLRLVDNQLLKKLLEEALSDFGGFVTNEFARSQMKIDALEHDERDHHAALNSAAEREKELTKEIASLRDYVSDLYRSRRQLILELEAAHGRLVPVRIRMIDSTSPKSDHVAMLRNLWNAHAPSEAAKISLAEAMTLARTNDVIVYVKNTDGFKLTSSAWWEVVS